MSDPAWNVAQMPIASADKLCTDCRHSTPRFSGIVFCTHAKNIVISKVDGAAEMVRSAEGARGNDLACGRVGAWFEAKA